jgi:hypothetical protein
MLWNFIISTPYIVKSIKSKGLKLAEYVVSMGEVRNIYIALLSKPEKKGHPGNITQNLDDNINI